MQSILEFIKVFDSIGNRNLFTDCACYWFSVILNQRFSDSSIVYDPTQVHFATKIKGNIYDITGKVENDEDYVDWEEYSSYAVDAEMIMKYCINLERR